MTGRSAIATLLSGAVSCCGAAAANADVTVATLDRPAPVSFFAGRLAWSAFDPAQGSYRLMTHSRGATSAVPVRPRGVPFDVDLGPDEHGDTVAVYSRCGREPGEAGTAAKIPKWRTGRGCDVFKFSFAAGRETRVAAANSAAGSEFLPSIWKTRISFARVYERRRGKAGDRAHLYARPVTGPGPSRRLTPGPRAAGVRYCSPSGRCSVPVETGPTALDMRGRRVAFAWGTSIARCERGTGIWLDTVGGGRRAIDHACSTEMQGREVVSPTISDGRVRYVRSLLAGELGTGSFFREYRIGSRRRMETSSIRGRVVWWAASDAGRTFYLLSGGFMAGCVPMPGIPGAGAPCLLNELQ